MGLKGDITELTTVWRESPWRVKVVLLLSGFIATSSIASLSEVVVKWKGFILTGLAFYQEYIRGPIVHVVHQIFRIQISRGYADLLALYILLAGAYARGLILDLKIDKTRFNLVHSLFWILLLTGVLIWEIYRAASAPADAKVNLLGLYIAYFVVILIMLLPPRHAWSMLVLVYLIVPPLLVCFAAAINLGLG